MDPGSRPTSTSSRTRTPLAPVRISREQTPEDDLLAGESQTAVTVDGELEMRKKDPLPPISTSELNLEDAIQSEMTGLAEESGITEKDLGSGASTPRPPRIVTVFKSELDGKQSPEPQGRSSTKPKSKVSTPRGTPVSEAGQRVMVSIETQTEWSWLEDMHNSTLAQTRASSSRTSTKGRSRKMSRRKVEESDEDEDGGSSRDVTDTEDSGRDATPQVMDRKASAISASSRHISSALTNKESYTSEPYPPRDDEYGIPMLNLDSELETYQRESEKSSISVEDPIDREKEILDKFKTEMQGEDENLFKGTCEFCNQDIKPFPTLEQQKSKPPEELYCCSGYCDFIQFMVKHPINEEMQGDRLIDVKPHLPYGSKKARKAAKERAAVRMREREAARQQAAMEARAAAGAAAASGGGGGPGFYQFARQMKTINFQLSSFKCLEEGWTVRPPSPVNDPADQEVFEPEPVLPGWAEGRPGATNERGLVRKFYPDGSLFVALFPDGTGNVYYPSGRPAITISSTEQGLFYYIAQKDNEDEGNLLAVFEPNGYGATYYNTGNIRLYLDQVGGVELDSRGARKRKWCWKDQVQHVHAPPIQPITFAVTPNLAVRVMDQSHITLTFSCKTRSCRFQVGSRLKLVAPENYPQPTYDDDELFRNDVRNKIESIMNKVSNLLKFPNCARLDRLSTPLHLTSRTQKIQKIRSAQARSKAKKEKTQNIISVN